jgi:hypothetical protein
MSNLINHPHIEMAPRASLTLRERFRIEHATIQTEEKPCEDSPELHP